MAARIPGQSARQNESIALLFGQPGCALTRLGWHGGPLLNCRRVGQPPYSCTIHIHTSRGLSGIDPQAAACSSSSNHSAQAETVAEGLPVLVIIDLSRYDPLLAQGPAHKELEGLLCRQDRYGLRGTAPVGTAVFPLVLLYRRCCFLYSLTYDQLCTRNDM